MRNVVVVFALLTCAGQRTNAADGCRRERAKTSAAMLLNFSLFAATLLSARKIIDALDSSKPNPGKDFFIDKAIKEAASILEKIDQRWPAEEVSEEVR